MKIKRLLLVLILLPQIFFAQKATISEELREFLTYPYSDPNPNPILMGSHKNIYPYHTFDGYSLRPQKQNWKVVKLENDYIVVYILPEIGGKVWGAIEKSTGKEFIYHNEVVKFRNISMRGPWTSGGIEFNFGIIGHNPSTASPVDYITNENADGSVSCIVGNTDLPSRTQWRVEIRLPKDKAYFETLPMWSNPTPFPQSYYNFMTGAAAVSDDLEFYYPGNQSLEHNGEAKSWPKDKDGHFLPKYANNAFGSHTSIHVVGDYNDYMGGYYHKSEFGFGHWALYDEMPGRKLWLWALSREGEIWKDLLTDTDGQYMEFQAGRTFNQYAQSDFRSSIKEMPFNPGVTDRWREIWFPVKEIGGIKEVSPMGVMNVIHENGKLSIAVNALSFAHGKIIITSKGKHLFSEEKAFKPMDVYKKSIDLANGEAFEVEIAGMDLKHESVNKNLTKRPFENTVAANTNSASHFYQLAVEKKENRNYIEAKINYQKCLQKDPIYVDAMVGLAELFGRQAQYDSALYYTQKVLQMDAYHPSANYFAGISYMAIGDDINALETLGWAARSMEYRTAAYAEMATIKLKSNDLALATHYALQALNYNKFNLDALKTLAVINRNNKNKERANAYLNEILILDPLNHFAFFEKYLWNESTQTFAEFSGKINNEFPYQTYLEIFLEYFKMGAKSDALKVLEKAPAQPLITVWKAYLTQNISLLAQAAEQSPAFVFPYRTETLEALKWAVDNNSHWKFKYYLGLNYWGIDRLDEAKKMFFACKNTPDYAPFYISRAFLENNSEKKQVIFDLQKAKDLNPADWHNWSKLIEGYEHEGNHKTALQLSSEAYAKFPNNFNIALQYAKVLLDNEQYQNCADILEKTTFIPFEGSTVGKEIFEQAYVNLALNAIKQKDYDHALSLLERSKAWPESLGVGAPFEPDNRLQQYLEAICLEKLGKKNEAISRRDSLINFAVKQNTIVRPNFNNLLFLNTLQKNGDVKTLNSSLKTLKSLPNFKGSFQEWVLASFNKDLKKVAGIEKGMGSNNYLKIFKKIKLLNL